MNNYFLYQGKVEPIFVAEIVTIDKWFVQEFNPVLPEVTQEGLYVIDPWLLTQPEAVSVDKWFVQEYNPILPRQPLTQGSFVYTELTLEIVTIDKWFVQSFNPIVPEVVLVQEGHIVIDPWLLTQSETIIIDKWFVQYHNPVLPILPLTSGGAVLVEFVTEIITIDKWFVQSFNPVLLKEALIQEGDFDIDPWLLTQSETISMDKWFVQEFNPVLPLILTIEGGGVVVRHIVPETITIDKWLVQHFNPPLTFPPVEQGILSFVEDFVTVPVVPIPVVPQEPQPPLQTYSLDNIKLFTSGFLLEGTELPYLSLQKVQTILLQHNSCAVREEESIGGYRVEPGAMILAKDLLFIDELNNLQEEDKSKLQEGMSEQKVSINKANIHCEMKVTCGIISAANPKEGTFKEFESNVEEQFDIPTPILNRFDTIFVLRDIVNEDNDKKIASKMIKRHRESLEHTYNKSFLRKFFAYVKQFEEPEINDEMEEILKKVYFSSRKYNNEGVKINPRFLESLTRMSIASAKARLNEVVELKDIERALEIIQNSQYKIDTKKILDDLKC